MLIAFLACGVTGVLKMPELYIAFGTETYANLSLVHDWTGVVAVVFVLIHVALHARWYYGLTKSILHRRTGAMASGGAKAVVVLLAVLLLLQANPRLWADRGGRSSRATVPQGIDYEAGSLKDGTYTGTADGYMPSLTVEVVVKNGVIGDIRIVKHQETMRWFNAVVKVIPDRIMKAQGTNIDAVAGATSSSHGIMSAVEAALRNAAR